MKTVTGTMGAWLTDYRATKSADPSDIENLSFTPYDMADEGWVKVGEAEITVTMRDKNEIIDEQVSVLKEAKRRIQAESVARVTQIDAQIQSLLAIEYKG